MQPFIGVLAFGKFLNSHNQSNFSTDSYPAVTITKIKIKITKHTESLLK